MAPAIRVNNLGKSYRLGGRGRHGYRTLRESITDAMQNIWRRSKETEEDRTLWALHGVDFEIGQGETVAVIGRNGSGKSTLLKILSRITEPTRGRAEVRGQLGSLLEVGTGFHPELTGRENIYLNGAILGMTRRDIARRFDDIVAFAELDRFLDTPVKRYSSGMYVRLAFAVAAHLELDVLVVDEVLAVGDQSFQKKCLNKMDEIGRTGRTILFVSHNMAAVKHLCSRCLLLSSGKLVADGTSDEVLARYLDEGQRSENGCFDLENHPARRSQHGAIIRRIELRSEGDETTSRFLAGEAIHITLPLESESAIRDPRVALAIEDRWGRRLTAVANYFDDCPLAGIRGRRQVRCTIPNPRLAPGQYMLSASIADKYAGLLDSIDCACWFDVAWNSNFSNGESYLPDYGPILTSSQWQDVSDAAYPGQ